MILEYKCTQCKEIEDPSTTYLYTSFGVYTLKTAMMKSKIRDQGRGFCGLNKIKYVPNALQKAESLYSQQ